MMDRVSSPADLPESTLADLFLDASDRHAGSLAYRYFADSGDDLTDLGFDDVYENVRAAAAGLHALGLSRGDKAALLAENHFRGRFDTRRRTGDGGLQGRDTALIGALIGKFGRIRGLAGGRFGRRDQSLAIAQRIVRVAAAQGVVGIARLIPVGHQPFDELV